MKALRAIAKELIGLFVDDGSLAALALIWLGICWLILPLLARGSAWSPVVLFLGLALILAESVVRGAGRRS